MHGVRTYWKLLFSGWGCDNLATAHPKGPVHLFGEGGLRSFLLMNVRPAPSCSPTRSGSRRSGSHCSSIWSGAALRHGAGFSPPFKREFYPRGLGCLPGWLVAGKVHQPLGKPLMRACDPWTHPGWHLWPISASVCLSQKMRFYRFRVTQ